jgi:hypothetical protein
VLAALLAAVVQLQAEVHYLVQRPALHRLLLLHLQR